jgi:hypothetical protein
MKDEEKRGVYLLLCVAHLCCTNSQNLKGLSAALTDNADAVDTLLKKHMIPFGILDLNEKGERPFLTCRYNKARDNQHRSPWTNQLYPKNEDDKTEKEEDTEIRLLEATYNEVWNAYKNLYYGHEAVGSVYLRESPDCTFQGLFGVCKKRENAGSWHSASFVHVDMPGPETCNYRVETFLVTILEPTSEDGTLKVDLSASLSKEITKECKIIPHMIAASHIENLGDLIETNEMDLRSQLERVQAPKAMELVDLLMKDKTKSFQPPGMNPLMGMIMDSSMLKKKLAK